MSPTLLVQEFLQDIGETEMEERPWKGKYSNYSTSRSYTAVCQSVTDCICADGP